MANEYASITPAAKRRLLALGFTLRRVERGPTGSGKSTRAHAFAAELRASGALVEINDEMLDDEPVTTVYAKDGPVTRDVAPEELRALLKRARSVLNTASRDTQADLQNPARGRVIRRLMADISAALGGTAAGNPAETQGWPARAKSVPPSLGETTSG